MYWVDFLKFEKMESYFTYTSEEESLIDHDIHFRPGIGVDRTETFTPRTVIYDLKGGFGSLRKINALYGIEEPDISDVLWNKPAIIQRLDSIEKCAYQHSLEQNLEPESLDSDTVKYWSDYNRVFYHPKSIVQLNEYEVGSTFRPFDSWDEGEELFKTSDKESDLVERDLRLFVEEADHMQAFQLISSTDDAWGSFAARYLEQIKDEYSKTDIIFWGLEEDITTKPREKRYTSLSNVAKSVSQIAPESTLFIPLTLPSKALPSYVTLERKSNWHVSALLSVAMESMTLLSRLRQKILYQENLDQLNCFINTNGRQNIAKLRMSIDKDSSHSDDVTIVPKILELNRDTRSPSTKKSPHFSEIATKSNIEWYQSKSFLYIAYILVWEPSIRKTRKDTILNQFFRKIVPLPFPLLDSFPQIFDQSGTPSSVTVRTSLTVDSTIASRLKAIKHIASRALAIDEREALSNSLGELAEAYEEGWDSGSDEGED
ncbi:hypothetical protein EPUL_001245 [Erysiphe pulchra]|uniref:Tubulin nucleotide-binding domain-like protein n=1 Tax=Erysiphe pulchra TaxID=225359 RepID=A0A2S4Q163_9PEZI|nr:hypothetical protein EPUL_001245 [Erysiphe pulchra]